MDDGDRDEATSRAAQSGALADVLLSDGPHGRHAKELALFGRFVGAWTLTWTGTGPDGRPLTMEGELRFGWVLGGRAVQDVWMVPADGSPRAEAPHVGFFGSTIRFFDPVINAWRSTWIEPINGRVRRFVGRAEGDDIVLLSDEDEPALRWRFTKIQPDRFTWIGEVSHDGGHTWELEETMVARRVARAT